jgi:hypothetical protein
VAACDDFNYEQLEGACMYATGSDGQKARYELDRYHESTTTDDKGRPLVAPEVDIADRDSLYRIGWRYYVAVLREHQSFLFADKVEPAALDNDLLLAEMQASMQEAGW